SAIVDGCAVTRQVQGSFDRLNPIVHCAHLKRMQTRWNGPLLRPSGSVKSNPYLPPAVFNSRPVNGIDYTPLRRRFEMNIGSDLRGRGHPERGVLPPKPDQRLQIPHVPQPRFLPFPTDLIDTVPRMIRIVDPPLAMQQLRPLKQKRNSLRGPHDR